jgi:hypothetical protein
MSYNDVRVAVRLRLGLPLSELAQPSVLSVVNDIRDSQNYPLGCVKLRRGGILKRQNGLARFARSNLCLVHVTPKTEDSSKVPDLDIVFAEKSVLVDVSGTDPLIPSIPHDVAGIPSHALAIRAGAKHTNYGQGVFSIFGGNFRWLGEGCPQTVELGFAGGIVPRFASWQAGDILARSCSALSGLAWRSP